MAKPTTVVHVQSSAFKDLLTVQQEALGTLKSMKQIMDGLTVLKADKAKPAQAEINPELKKIEEENIRLKKQILNINKDEIKTLKERLKLQDEEAEAISNISKNMKLFYSPLEKVKNGLEKMKNTFTEGGGIRGALLKTFNIGGIFNKSIEREKFIRAQQTMGSAKSREELKKDFAGAQASAKQLKRTEAEIERFQKTTGLSESDMGKTVGGRKLLDQRKAQAEEYAKYDEKAKLVRRGEPTIKPSMGGLGAEQAVKKTPTQTFADQGQQEEQSIEQNKMIGEQTVLLTKIEENTRGDSPEQKAKPKEEKEDGGGLLGNLLGGGGMGKALGALKQFGVGIVLVAGALFVAAKAFQQFAEVEWESVGKGLVALGGLTLAAIGLSKVQGDLVKASIGLGALALVTWGISKAFSAFAELEWETIGKGFATIIGLGVVGVVLGNFAGPAVLGALALGALGAAVWVVGKGFQEMEEPFAAFIEGIEKLSNIGFQGLAGVAGGLLLLGPAMAAFAAGNALAGMGNLVSGLLSAVTGQKSPVDQLVEIGKSGQGITQAASGMEQLGKAMKAFGGVKKSDMEAINDFPWIRATAFVAAGGAMSVNGASVYNQSKANADAKAETSKGGPAGGTTVVNAPVNNTTRQNNFIKAPIRNQDSSLTRYQQSTYNFNYF